MFYTNKTFYEVFNYTVGLGKYFKRLVSFRLELSDSVDTNVTDVSFFKKKYKREIIGFLNRFYSQVASVNDILPTLQRLNIIRLYLIKSYKGKCHALGKPVNGQRTWSNAWSSYKINKILRKFISESKMKILKDKRPEKINYRLTKKKYGSNKQKQKKYEEKKRIWF